MTSYTRLAGPSPLVEYYTRRAPEYDLVYLKPERQPDLRRIETRIERAFVGRDVLEVACGTGYWARLIARRAASVPASVNFLLADA